MKENTKIKSNAIQRDFQQKIKECNKIENN